jgi:T5SS/PEP-CTERM-associated repeat protein
MWTNSGLLSVGGAGSGTLTIDAGGNVSNTEGIISIQSGAVGSATVKGAGSTWTNSQSLTVGNLGTGTLKIEQGGSVSNGQARIADQPNSTGEVTVTGSGSTWASSVLFVGNSGNGTLTIENAGKVSSASGAAIGANDGSTGAAKVIGAGSSWTNGGPLVVGYFGAGTLRVESGAQISSAFDTITSGIGRIEGSTGEVTISGAGSTWTDSGSIVVGGEGSGILTIDAGGRVSTGAGSLGSAANSIGALTVAGAGSMWSGSQTLTIGGAGRGSLMISGGGSVSNGSGEIAFAPTGVGNVTVTGAGSKWTNSNDLSVGGHRMGSGGTGELRVINNGLVEVGGQLKIWNGGTLTIDGGSVVTQPIDISTGGTLNFLAGSLSYMGNLTVGTGGMLGTNLTLGPNRTLTLSGTTSVDASHTLTLDGGSLTTDGLDLDGALVFHSGTLELTGGLSSGPASLAVPTHGQLRARGIHNLQIVGVAGSNITATGELALGHARRVNGFYTNGTLEVGMHTVSLNDANDVVFDSGALVSLGAGDSGGTLTAANGLTLDFGGNISGVGTVNTPNNAAMPLVNNGHIAGLSAALQIALSGYVKGVGTLDNVVITGTDAPGFSPATVYRGSVTYSGTLAIEIGGTTTGSFDRIIHSGTATLGGVLDVSLTGGFVPKAADSFDLLDWATVTGTFATLNLPALAGLEWDTSRLYSDGLLAIVATGLVGDYNQNDIVDAADYVVWRESLGQMGQGLAADGNGDGIINQADYDVWRSHFGSIASGVNAGADTKSIKNTSAVPEPASTVLVCLALVTAARWRRSMGPHSPC